MIFHERIYFECVIPEKNRFAFYELIAGRDLYGDVLVRRWGRIGTRGQPAKRQRFQNNLELMREFKRVYQERIKHDYIPRLSS